MRAHVEARGRIHNSGESKTIEDILSGCSVPGLFAKTAIADAVPTSAVGGMGAAR